MKSLAAVLEDFRRLELVRDGRKRTMHSRLRQDKGHRAEWAAFAHFLKEGGELPISFNEIVSSTLATLCIDASLAMGAPVRVDTAAFLYSAQTASDLNAGPEV